ncbi:hypothetical protein E2C01_024016 [Portunus trituberculatus]|uniref:Uncharacterized protein n=1 Tax=Portunus trituberculatus TaxID=210409 RepID=A0A5B7EC28_PORTR|nr:hypothetical protein [Portunus trituberculatus]
MKYRGDQQTTGLTGWEGIGLELTVKLAFITGFDDCVSMEQKQVTDIDTASVSDLTTKARKLVLGYVESVGNCNQRTEHSDMKTRPNK